MFGSRRSAAARATRWEKALNFNYYSSHHPPTAPQRAVAGQLAAHCDRVKEETLIWNQLEGEETVLSQRSAFQLRNGLPVNKETKQTMIYDRHRRRGVLPPCKSAETFLQQIAEDVTGSARHEM